MKFNSLLILFLCLAHGAFGQAEFVQNRGQWPQGVRFRAALPAGNFWVEEDGFTVQLFDPAILQAIHPSQKPYVGDSVYREHSYKIQFFGGRAKEHQAIRKQSHYYNYYLGNNPKLWATGCEVSEKCRLSEVYAGTDVLVYSSGNSMKYDFVVRPGADPRALQLKLVGAGLKLQNGELHITTSVGTVVEKAPYAYQLIGGKLHEVACSFLLKNEVVSFQLGSYNKDFELIIDPEIAFSTFIGSTASNFGFTACDDSNGNLISGAAVFAAGYPTTTGAYSTTFNNALSNYMDIAVSKFSADGSALLYSTYLGGSLQETPHSVVVDSQDNILLMGVTGSANFPTTVGSYQSAFIGGTSLPMTGFFVSSHPQGTDFFITKLSATGALAASTFVGGTGNDGLNYAPQLYYNYGDVFRGEINVDNADNIYVASVSFSTDFPLVNNTMQALFGGGSCDGVVFKLNNALSNLMWSTYLGGSANDACYAIQFSNTGIITVAGGTRSNNFPHLLAGVDNSFDGQTDGFVVRINPQSFALMSGTLIGTPDYDQVYFLQFDDLDNIYICGQTAGFMAITPGCYGQPNSGQFIAKLNSTLSAVVWLTTIGTSSGEIDISLTAFLVSRCRQIYFSGWGGSYCGGTYTCQATASTTTGLPVTADAFQSTTDGRDFYLCTLSPDATSLVYGSFLGGAQSAEHVDGGTSRFNKNGTVFQAVCAGCQGNSDFPTTPGVWSNTNNSFGCNLAVFRFNLNEVDSEIAIDGPDQVCVNSVVPLINQSTGATSYQWYFGDGSGSQVFLPQHVYLQPGEYTITLIGSNNAECAVSDTASIQITILPGVNPTAPAGPSTCPGEPVQISASGTPNLFWLPNATLSATNVPNPVATPTVSTTYYAVDFNSCDTDTIAVVVNVYPVAIGVGPPQTICIGQACQLSASGGVAYTWTPSTGLDNPTAAITNASPQQSTNYQVQVTTADNCQATGTVNVVVIQSSPGDNVYPDVFVCKGSSAQLLAADGINWIWQPASTLSNAFVQNPMASPLENTTYQIQIENACGVGVDQVTVYVLEAEVIASGGGSICKGSSLWVNAQGALNYQWSPAQYCSPPYAQETYVSPPQSMWFKVTGVDSNNCVDQDSVYVVVWPLPLADAGPDQYYDYPGSAYLFGNPFGNLFWWTPSEGLSCTDCEYPVASPEVDMHYTLHVMDANGCIGSDSVYVRPYFPLWVPNTITPNGDGLNDVFRAYGQNITGFHLIIFNRWGVKVFESYDINDVWVGGVEDYYAQNDVYPWVIEYDTKDRKARISGHVTVVR